MPRGGRCGKLAELRGLSLEVVTIRRHHQTRVPWKSVTLCGRRSFSSAMKLRYAVSMRYDLSLIKT